MFSIKKIRDHLFSSPKAYGEIEELTSHSLVSSSNKKRINSKMFGVACVISGVVIAVLFSVGAVFGILGSCGAVSFPQALQGLISSIGTIGHVPKGSIFVCIAVVSIVLGGSLIILGIVCSSVSCLRSKSVEKPDKSEKTEESDELESFDESTNSEKSEKIDKSEKVEESHELASSDESTNSAKAEKSEEAEESDEFESSEKLDKSEKSEKDEKPDNFESFANLENSDHSEKTDKPDKSEKDEKPDKFESSEKFESYGFNQEPVKIPENLGKRLKNRKTAVIKPSQLSRKPSNESIDNVLKKGLTYDLNTLLVWAQDYNLHILHSSDYEKFARAIGIISRRYHCELKGVGDADFFYDSTNLYFQNIIHVLSLLPKESTLKKEVVQEMSRSFSTCHATWLENSYWQVVDLCQPHLAEDVILTWIQSSKYETIQMVLSQKGYKWSFAEEWHGRNGVRMLLGDILGLGEVELTKADRFGHTFFKEKYKNQFLAEFQKVFTVKSLITVINMKQQYIIKNKLDQATQTLNAFRKKLEAFLVSEYSMTEQDAASLVADRFIDDENCIYLTKDGIFMLLLSIGYVSDSPDLISNSKDAYADLEKSPYYY